MLVFFSVSSTNSGSINHLSLPIKSFLPLFVAQNYQILQSRPNFYNLGLGIGPQTCSVSINMMKRAPIGAKWTFDHFESISDSWGKYQALYWLYWRSPKGSTQKNKKYHKLNPENLQGTQEKLWYNWKSWISNVRLAWTHLTRWILFLKRQGEGDSKYEGVEWEANGMKGT